MLFICRFRSMAPPVTSMDVIDWLERNRYVSSYAGEWIVISGKAGASAHKLEFHGKQREDAMEIIERMYESTPDLWTIAIKIPYNLGMKFSE
jgi:thiamine monophosphate kinase